MLKSELVFLEVFSGAKSQKAIAEKIGISLSTVNNAIKPLERIGAISKKRFGFDLVDKEKALLFWASSRNLEKDIVYKTRVQLPVSGIEGSMPSGVIFTAFTAFRLKFNEVPADYSEVYVYANEEELSEIKKRFPPADAPPNLLVLEKPAIFFCKKVVTNELLFVDLWNLKEWYSKEFLIALKKKTGFE